MLGTNAPDQWEMTRSFALNVATGGNAEPNVEPVQRIRLEQLSRVAELNVIEATGMPVSPDGRRLTCVPVGRGRLDAAGARLVAARADRDDPGARPDAPGRPGPMQARRRSLRRRRPDGRDREPARAVGHRHRPDVLRPAGGIGGRPPVPAGPRAVPAGDSLGAVRRAAPGHVQHRRVRRGLEPPRGGGAALGVRPRAGVQLGPDPSGDQRPDGGVAPGPGRVLRLGPAGPGRSPRRARCARGRRRRRGMDLESLQGMFGDPEALLGDL